MRQLMILKQTYSIIFKSIEKLIDKTASFDVNKNHLHLNVSSLL